MFNEYVILHTPQATDGPPESRLGKCSEKMTQTSDGNIWQVSLPNNIGASSLQQLSPGNLANSQHSIQPPTTTNHHHNRAALTDCSDLNLPEAMTCQELLAFSVAFSAALPTGHMALESFYTSLARGTTSNSNSHHPQQQTNLASSGNNHDDNGGVVPSRPRLNSFSNNNNNNNNNCEPINGNKGGVGGGVAGAGGNGGANNNSNLAVLPLSASPSHPVSGAGGPYPTEDFSCCCDLYQGAMVDAETETRAPKSKFTITLVMIYRFVSKFFWCIQRQVKRLVEHKYFQQGILLAILINTLSMGIEYHNQPPELTVIVETSNVVFSAIFAVEMLLKIVAEGPFRYIANGFNVFDGVIVILR